MHDTLFASVASRGVRIVALIHHSHGVKAVAALTHLRSAFPHWTEAFWRSALGNATWFDEPVVDGPVQTPAPPLSERRAQVLLDRAVLPLAYQATREWARSAGTEAVVSHYLQQACADPQYLGHRVSVLLGFLDAWPLYKDGPDSVLFLDRLTEFILACKFSAPTAAPSTRQATFEEALSAGARRSGFFGHHLIVLAWVHRFQGVLTPAQRGSAFAWVVDSGAAHYEEDEDNVDVTAAAAAIAADASLETTLQNFLLHGKRNIHLLTLADALVQLWAVANDDARRCLLATAEHYAADAVG